MDMDRSRPRLRFHFICATDRIRVDLRSFFEAEPAIDINSPRIVSAHGQKSAFTAPADSFRERGHNSSRVAAAFKTAQCSHSADLAVSRQMQAQAAHCYQLAFFAHAHKAPKLIQ